MEAKIPVCEPATGLSRRERKRKRRNHRNIEVLDLTDDNAYCTRCTHVLGAGEGYASAIYALHRCGCMFCGNCILYLSNKDGKPMLLPRIDAITCCKKSGCSTRPQRAYRTWGLDCAICSRSLAELYGTRKPRMPCGHWFCEDCTLEHTKVENEKHFGRISCPVCRAVIGAEARCIFLKVFPKIIEVKRV